MMEVYRVGLCVRMDNFGDQPQYDSWVQKVMATSRDDAVDQVRRLYSGVQITFCVKEKDYA